MRQKIYPDPYGIDVWDLDNYGRVTIHIVNSVEYREITGRMPPPTPIDAATYTAHQLPWFDLYDETQGDVDPSKRLTQVKTIAVHDAERGVADDASVSFEVSEDQVKTIHPGETGALDAPDQSRPASQP